MLSTCLSRREAVKPRARMKHHSSFHLKEKCFHLQILIFINHCFFLCPFSSPCPLPPSPQPLSGLIFSCLNPSTLRNDWWLFWNWSLTLFLDFWFYIFLLWWCFERLVLLWRVIWLSSWGPHAYGFPLQTALVPWTLVEIAIWPGLAYLQSIPVVGRQ